MNVDHDNGMSEESIAMRTIYRLLGLVATTGVDVSYAALVIHMLAFYMHSDVNATRFTILIMY